jgi:hypothetical protein
MRSDEQVQAAHIGYPRVPTPTFLTSNTMARFPNNVNVNVPIFST